LNRKANVFHVFVEFRIGWKFAVKALWEALDRRLRMPDHLLTFELAKEGDELLIHADAAGLRYLASALARLAQHAEAGRKEHAHMTTEDWSGHELSSVAQGTDCSLLHQVTIHGWPTKEG
jgi:hypothetical protein